VKAGRVHIVDPNLWPGFGHLWARALADDLERLFVTA
jgi:ABC-type Fe3+-hydroxamate transport system substrate-binding protein